MRIDRDLVRTIEWAAAEHASQQAAAIGRLAPGTGAAAVPFDGGALVAFGHDRYVNRAIGLGLHDASAEAIVAALVDFYDARGLPPSLELSPWAASPFVSALGAAGFHAERFRSIYVHPLTDVPDCASVQIDLVRSDTREQHKEILADGARGVHSSRAVSDEYCDANATIPGSHHFVASIDGRVAACGSVSVVGSIAYLGGAVTMSECRSRGLQSALVAHRLHVARDEGCSYATCSAVPDGQSAQNLVRLGFQLIYTQVVLTRPAA